MSPIWIICAFICASNFDPIFFNGLGGNQRDAGWDGSGASKPWLAILSIDKSSSVESAQMERNGGYGLRLFEHLGKQSVKLTKIKILETPTRATLQFRIG